MQSGASQGRRHAASPDPDLDGAIPRPTAQCANCETWILLAGGKLPQGWVLIDGQAVCADCAPPPAGALSAVAGQQDMYRIGPETGQARFRGCRMSHEITLGTVSLRIHAGATPPPPGVRDDPVHFVADTQELGQLITRLQIIQLELNTTRQQRDY